MRADEAVVDAAHLRSFGCDRALEARKSPISKAGEVKSADDVGEVLVQKRCTDGLQDDHRHDCSPEPSREPPLELAGYPTCRERQQR